MVAVKVFTNLQSFIQDLANFYLRRTDKIRFKFRTDRDYHTGCCLLPEDFCDPLEIHGKCDPLDTSNRNLVATGMFDWPYRIPNACDICETIAFLNSHGHLATTPVDFTGIKEKMVSLRRLPEEQRWFWFTLPDVGTVSVRGEVDQNGEVWSLEVYGCLEALKWCWFRKPNFLSMQHWPQPQPSPPNVFWPPSWTQRAEDAVRVHRVLVDDMRAHRALFDNLVQQTPVKSTLMSGDIKGSEACRCKLVDGKWGIIGDSRPFSSSHLPTHDVSSPSAPHVLSWLNGLVEPFAVDPRGSSDIKDSKPCHCKQNGGKFGVIGDKRPTPSREPSPLELAANSSQSRSQSIPTERLSFNGTTLIDTVPYLQALSDGSFEGKVWRWSFLDEDNHVSGDSSMVSGDEEDESDDTVSSIEFSDDDDEDSMSSIEFSSDDESTVSTINFSDDDDTVSSIDFSDDEDSDETMSLTDSSGNEADDEWEDSDSDDSLFSLGLTDNENESEVGDNSDGGVLL